jgi:hypothetical protein
MARHSWHAHKSIVVLLRPFTLGTIRVGGATVIFVGKKRKILFTV